MQATATDPIPFSTFVTDFGGNAALAEGLPSEFYNSPEVCYFPESRYARQEYQKDYINGAIANLFKYVLEPMAMESRVEKRMPPKEWAAVFGFAPNPDYAVALKTLLFTRAAFFQFSKYGACSYRCCYAALRLVKIFQKTDLAIHVEAAKVMDHYTVMLGNKNRGWFVYDPLTNPDLVFPVELYNREVLPTFTKVRREEAERFSLKITPQLADDYFSAWPRIQDLMVQLCQKNKGIKDNVLRDDKKYIALLKCEGIPKAETRSYSKRAIGVFKDFLASQPR